MLLLDTHTWIWTVEGNPRRIGRQARRLLSRAQSDGNIHVSPVSCFEITALHASGRLRLTRSPAQWIRDALEVYGVRVAEMSVDVALDAGSITRAALADPLDRLLVVTARQLDATFLTSDTQILAYAAATGIVRVRDASL